MIFWMENKNVELLWKNILENYQGDLPYKFTVYFLIVTTRRIFGHLNICQYKTIKLKYISFKYKCINMYTY